ncbi:MAG: hypothetical protein WCK29_02095 [archaeon]
MTNQKKEANEGHGQFRLDYIVDRLLTKKSNILVGRESIRRYQGNEWGGTAFDYATRSYHFHALDKEGIERFFRGDYFIGPVGKGQAHCSTNVNSAERKKNQRATFNSIASAALSLANSLVRKNVSNYKIFNGLIKNTYGQEENIEKLSKTELRLFRSVLKRVLKRNEIYEADDLYNKLAKQ